MAIYKKSVELREVIVSAFRKLFYEKGYTKTRFSDLTEMTNIAGARANYHFKKDAISEIIIDDYIKRISELLYDSHINYSDYLCLDMLGAYIYHKIILSDTNNTRFYNELLDQDVIRDYSVSRLTDYIRSFSASNGLRSDTISMNLLCESIYMIHKTIFDMVKIETNPVIVENSLRFAITMPYRMLSLDPQFIDSTYDTSKSLYETLDTNKLSFLITEADIHEQS